MNEAQQLQQMQPLLYKQLKKVLSMVVLPMLIFLKEIQELEKQEFGLWMAKHVFLYEFSKSTAL